MCQAFLTHFLPLFSFQVRRDKDNDFQPESGSQSLFQVGLQRVSVASRKALGREEGSESGSRSEIVENPCNKASAESKIGTEVKKKNQQHFRLVEMQAGSQT